jgi:hypothetical protein
MVRMVEMARERRAYQDIKAQQIEIEEVPLRPKSLEMTARLLIEKKPEPDPQTIFMTSKQSNLVDIMQRTELRHSHGTTRA